MGGIPEVEVRDLQELIFVLTQDVWQPSEARYRMSVAYRGLPSSSRGLETGLARLRGNTAGALEGHLCATSASTRIARPPRAPPSGTG